MGPLLTALTELQGVENRLRAMNERLARCNRTVTRHENKIRNEQNTLAAKKEEIQLTRLQSDKLELELRSRDEEIAKFRTALNSAKSNKEYATLLTHLNTSKADNSKLETQILDYMKTIEGYEEQAKIIVTTIQELEDQLGPIRQKAEKEAQEYKVELERIQAEWDRIASGINKESLDIFKRVSDTYDGEAVVYVENEGRAYSCSGCYMGVTTECANQLMTRDEIIRCPNCTRILVLAPPNATS